MTAAFTIVREVLECYAGIYYACGNDAHAAREQAIEHAATAIRPKLHEMIKKAVADAAANPS